MIKRTLSVCLAFVLLLGTLVGCSKNETKTDNSGQNTQQETIPELASQYAYQPQYFDLPEPIQWIGAAFRAVHFILLPVFSADRIPTLTKTAMRFLMTPIPRAFSGLTLTAENAYSSSTTLTSLMWKIWTMVHRFSAAATAAPRSMPSRPAQTVRSGSTAGQTFTRMTARWGPPFRSSSSWMRMARCFAPSSPQTRKIRTAQETGAIRTLTPCSPMIRAMSILTIIRQSMFMGRMAASFSANPLMSFPASSASSLPVKSAH